MRKYFFAILLLAGTGYFLATTHGSLTDRVNNLLYQSPCDTPISYKIGAVDERFQIPKDTFAQDISEASNIWDNAVNKKLFIYDPNARLTISLVFDQRQSLNQQINQLENQLDTQKNSLQPEIAAYEAEVASFKKKVADLNQQIDYWNSKGGAPKDVYDNLSSQQKSLQQEADKLNTMARSLNQSTDSFNSQIGELNQTVNNFNLTLQGKPEEGLYDPKGPSISIYITNGHQELVHTLAHELGHALGMDHVTNPQSIMYAFTNKIIVTSDEDTNQLQFICQKRNIIYVYGLELKSYLQQLSTRFSTGNL